MHLPVERALEKLGKAGKYQKLVILYLFFIAGFVNYLLLGPTYIFMNPIFKCSFAEDLVDESIACDRISECVISNGYTLVAHMELYCGRQIQRNLIQSINSIGSIFGLSVINILSDYKGKKLALIIGHIAAILSIGVSLLGGYLKSVVALLIAQFLGGFAGNSMIFMAYIYPSQISSEQFRQMSLIIINYSWCLTSVLLGILSFLETQWSTFLLIYVLIPMGVVLLASFFFLVEGPNFLYSVGKQKECLDSFRTISKYNGTEDKFKEVEASFKQQSALEKSPSVSIPEALKAVLRDSFYRKMIIILTLSQAAAALYYVATNYALFDLGFDYGINLTATGFIQLLAFIYLQFRITKISKKTSMLVLYAIMVVLGMLFFIHEVRDSRIATFLLICALRYFGTIAYALVLLLLTEVFPSQVQAICTGIIQSIAQLGGFLGPIIITLCINMQIYPIIVLSFVLIVGLLIPASFLQQKRPEKLQQPLLIEEQRKEEAGTN